MPRSLAGARLTIVVATVFGRHSPYLCLVQRSLAGWDKMPGKRNRPGQAARRQNVTDLSQQQTQMQMQMACQLQMVTDISANIMAGFGRGVALGGFQAASYPPPSIKNPPPPPPSDGPLSSDGASEEEDGLSEEDGHSEEEAAAAAAAAPAAPAAPGDEAGAAAPGDEAAGSRGTRGREGTSTPQEPEVAEGRRKRTRRRRTYQSSHQDGGRRIKVEEDDELEMTPRSMWRQQQGGGRCEDEGDERNDRSRREERQHADHQKEEDWASEQREQHADRQKQEDRATVLRESLLNAKKRHEGQEVQRVEKDAAANKKDKRPKKDASADKIEERKMPQKKIDPREMQRTKVESSKEKNTHAKRDGPKEKEGHGRRQGDGDQHREKTTLHGVRYHGDGYHRPQRDNGQHSEDRGQSGRGLVYDRPQRDEGHHHEDRRQYHHNENTHHSPVQGDPSPTGEIWTEFQEGFNPQKWGNGFNLVREGGLLKFEPGEAGAGATAPDEREPIRVTGATAPDEREPIRVTCGNSSISSSSNSWQQRPAVKLVAASSRGRSRSYATPPWAPSATSTARDGEVD